MKNLKIYIFTVLLIVAAWCFPVTLISMNNKYWLTAAILFFMVNTLFSLYKIKGALTANQSRFNATYFGSMGLKMICAFIFIVMYLKFSELLNKGVLLGMVCIYFIYMGFEIQFILYKLRTNSEKSQNGDDARK
ncbi:MAG: hypothetical protein V4613_08455 [Bacteroidota bacterium]